MYNTHQGAILTVRQPLRNVPVDVRLQNVARLRQGNWHDDIDDIRVRDNEYRKTIRSRRRTNKAIEKAKRKALEARE